MNTFYSLIKICLNELSGDSLTIGMILSSPEKVTVHFSYSKKQLVNKLNTNASYWTKIIEAEINKKATEYNKYGNNLFAQNTMFSADYFTYLSKYSNGLLKFSEPNPIAVDAKNKEVFDKLFNLFVDYDKAILHKHIEDYDKIKQIKDRFYQNINENLIDKIKDKVHTRYVFNEDTMPTLNHKLTMDCIGLNGALIGAKGIPLLETTDTILKKVGYYSQVITQLSYKYDKPLKNNSFYLIADQPEKSSEQFNVWERINKDPLFKIIPSNESGLVSEEIKKREAHTFLRA